MEAYPAPIGLEAWGIIESIDTGVDGFVVGDRVAYHSSAGPGAYTEKRILKTSDIFKLPEDISFDQAASVIVKGLTAHMLLKQSHEVKPHEVVLIHAMTGGVGTLLSEWARHSGVTVIGTVGSAAKKDLALKRGFDYVVDLQSEDFVEKVRKFTKGKGIDVVYDGTGEATFQKSLDLIKEGGSAVLYGWPSGMPVIDMEFIKQRKICFVGAVLNNYIKDKERSNQAVTEIFDLLRKGVFNLQKPWVYPLAAAVVAHTDLESRKTTGSIILRP
jgi:NADPH2:quinone reductase